MLTVQKIQSNFAPPFGIILCVLCFPTALTAEPESLFTPEQPNRSLFNSPSDLATSGGEIPALSSMDTINLKKRTGIENQSEPLFRSTTQTDIHIGNYKNYKDGAYSEGAKISEPSGTFNSTSSFANSDTFDQNEILTAGHIFFGSITEGFGKGIEYLFQSLGKPNAYILGEDASGALVIGLRYGEGLMHLKNSPPEKVFWQGPTIGYDAGAEGSKTMVLVYNLKDASEIYDRYAGVQGSAYFVGGISIQLQKHDYVTLAIIRSGVGIRLGANIGYLNYTRTPSWNPL